VGTLYVVGTPIGNLQDLSDRARTTLGAVDVVAAEDTRRTGRLLAGIGVRARLISYFEGNESRRVPELVRMLHDGSDVALVTDGGMPGVSDPGYRLVAACVEEGIPVDVVPGPSAALAALVVSGLPTDRFTVEGFLPRAGRKRAERLAAVTASDHTVVVFESPYRVRRTLDDLLALGVDRRMAMARELTKLHQEVIRGTVSEVRDHVAGRSVKGEVTLVIEGTPRPRQGTAGSTRSPAGHRADSSE
jgi:16S rRNA (cytidine1402-2'-O)-methyltransferase